MREIALASLIKNKDIIDNLYLEIKSKLDFCSPIITNYCDNNFCYLLLACDEEFENTCESILRDVIIDYVEANYKVDYLKRKIKQPIKDKLTFDAYIKVLAVFDKSTDEVALKQIIQFAETFFVDSFLEFRLTPLKRHWDNLAELSSDNLAMFNSNTFIDVIKFLLNTMESEVYKIKVVVNENRFSVYNMQRKNDKVKKIADCFSSADLISNVLTACPNYVDIYLNSNNDCEAVSFLSNVFSNRLKIYMKNS